MIEDHSQSAIQNEDQENTPAIPRLPPLIALSAKIFNAQQRITLKLIRNHYNVKKTHTSASAKNSDYRLISHSASTTSSDTENTSSDRSYHSEEMPPRSESPNFNMYENNSPDGSEMENRLSPVEQWVCKFCPKTYTKWKRFTKHRSRHYARSSFSCKYCDKVFSSRPAWDYHTKSKHKKEKNFICEECDKAFVTKQQLQLHIKRHQYICHFCGESFPIKSDLSRHKEIHRTLQCELCPSAFYRQHRLQRHIELKHPHARQSSAIDESRGQQQEESVHQEQEEHLCETEKTPMYQEEDEESSYQEKEQESTYDATPSPQPTEVKCKYCENIFPSMDDLRHHWKVTGDNLFICAHCLEICDNELAFSHHLLIHSEEKIFTCTLCWKTFVAMDLLENHFSTHSGLSI